MTPEARKTVVTVYVISAVVLALSVALAAPLVAAWLFALLLAIVSMADFTMFTGGTERAFGGFVATGVLAASTWGELIRERAARRQSLMTMVCS